MNTQPLGRQAFVGTLLVAASTLALSSACGSRQASGADPGYQAVLSRSDISGNALSAQKPGRATAVVVFASWCGPCRKELAMLKGLAAETPDLRVIGVNAFEEYDDKSNLAKLEQFIAVQHPWLTVVRSDAALLNALGGVRKIPTMFVYDKNGALVQSFRRSKRQPPNRDEMQAILTQLH